MGREEGESNFLLSENPTKITIQRDTRKKCQYTCSNYELLVFLSELMDTEKKKKGTEIQQYKIKFSSFNITQQKKQGKRRDSSRQKIYRYILSVNVFIHDFFLYFQNDHKSTKKVFSDSRHSPSGTWTQSPQKNILHAHITSLHLAYLLM